MTDLEKELVEKLAIEEQSPFFGGQVLVVAMPDEVIAAVPDGYRNRLLSKAEVVELWPDAKPLREWESDEK